MAVLNKPPFYSKLEPLGLLGRHKWKDSDSFFEKYGVNPIDIMLLGPNGCGKTALIKSLVGKKTLCHATPITSSTCKIAGYEPSKGIRIWDTPGFGVNNKQDMSILNSLRYWLGCKTGGFSSLIDVAFVIIDGRSLDLNPAIKILNGLTHAMYAGKIIIGINFVDQYADGKGWDKESNTPSKQLKFHITHIEQAIINKLFIKTRVLVDDYISFSTIKNYRTPKVIPLIKSHFELTSKN